MLIAACETDGIDPPGDKPDNPGDDTGELIDPGVEDPGIEPEIDMLVTGHEGSLVIISSAEGIGNNHQFQAYATFAEDLMGFPRAAWCAGGGPCLETLHDNDTWIDTTDADYPDNGTSFTWVGDEVFVNGYSAPWTSEDGGNKVFYGVEVLGEAPTGAIGYTIAAGQWGHHVGDAFGFPEPLDITSPLADVPISLMDEVIEFRWTPASEGQVYLHVESDVLSRLYLLEDDGEFDLEVASLESNIEIDVSLTLGRWVDRGEVDVNGNTLKLTSVVEQAFGATECTNYPDATYTDTTWDPDGIVESPSYLGISFEALIDNRRVNDWWQDTNGDGVLDPQTAHMKFTFYNLSVLPVCSIYYDASDYVRVNHWISNDGGEIWEAFDVNFSEGFSDCPPVSALVWGSDDLRDWIESPSFDWGFGVGEMTAALRDPLSAFWGSGTWATRGPQTMGGYISLSGWDAYELSPTRAFELAECGVVDRFPAAVERPKESPVFDALYIAEQYYIFVL